MSGADWSYNVGTDDAYQGQSPYEASTICELAGYSDFASLDDGRIFTYGCIDQKITVEDVKEMLRENTK